MREARGPAVKNVRGEPEQLARKPDEQVAHRRNRTEQPAPETQTFISISMIARGAIV